MRKLKAELLRLLRRIAPRVMHRKALSNRQWSEVEEELLPLIVDVNRESVDVGANVGSYAARLSGCSKWVHAFEPDTESANFLGNAGYPNVTVYAVALSHKDGEETLRIPRNESGPIVTLASIGSDAISEGDEIYTRRIKTEKLDQLLDRDIGFVKIDVEGHELSVLEGGQNVLDACRPTLLIEIEERHGKGAISAVRKFLESRGYVGFFLFGNRTSPISDFLPSMQDTSELSRSVPRAQMSYVNNFFFAPSYSVAIKMREVIDDALSKSASFEGRPHQ